ncbi:MAG: PilC family type IV pilus tip adhesin [Neisseria sp.]|uniref:PilC family type IV pilus tip adhesin n=1 Tax=Neisseria sp. TaxID=192066 RepID=UPI0026DBB6A2|nr:PilC family type IV pilus tip adhesin [Neisseria sp.]MDO4641377.1 PilC family type IV pilus tip adhesin [Neisseria sp.]
MLLIDDSGSMKWIPETDREPRYNGEESRLSITKNALNIVLDKYQDQLNWSLQTLNNNNDVQMAHYTDNWQNVKNIVNNITAKGGTPTTRRYYEVSQFVRDQTKYRCQPNYIVVMSDGDANYSYTVDRWVRGYNHNHRRDNSYSPNNVYPVFGARNRLQDSYFGTREGGDFDYSVTLNRGSLQVDIWDTIWDRNDGLKWFSKTLATRDFKTEGTDATGVSWNGGPNDPKVDGKSKYAKQLVNTFTVGFGKGMTRQGETYLQNGASDASFYYKADDAEELSLAFKKIFEIATSSDANTAIESGSTAAPAIIGTKSANAVSAVQLDSGSWSSQIHLYVINNNKILNSYKQPSFTNRKTLINTGAGTYFVDQISANNNAGLNNQFFGITDNGQNSTEWLNALLPWTVRSNSKTDEAIQQEAKNNNYSQTYRIREQGKRDLGDIIDSPLTAIGPTSHGRQEFLVTAANDGMVHIFQSANSANNPYDLKLSYIPAAMERGGENGSGGDTLAKTLKEVANQQYGKDAEHPHRYLINGGLTAIGTPPNKQGRRQFFMFGAMGQGGRGAYALNIGGYNRVNNTAIALNNNSSAWDKEVPLFETEKGKNNKLGYTIGTPNIGRVSINSEKSDIRYAGFLASGYSKKPDVKSTNQDTDNETALYIYDMLGQDANTGAAKGKSGTLLKKIVVNNGVGGLSSPVLLDTNLDGIYDLAYAGDYGGNMYRFDLRGNLQDWKVTRIFAGKRTQPITAAPIVSYRSKDKYVIIFGTGSDIYNEDLENKDAQSIYGIFDDVSQTPTASATSNDLLKQTFTQRGQNYYLSNNKIESNHKGWQIDLTGFKTGERVVTQGKMILKTAVLDTRAYVAESTTKTSSKSDLCLPDTETTKVASDSRQIQMNSENGGALTAKSARINYYQGSYVDPKTKETFYANAKAFLGSLISTNYQSATNNTSPTTLDGQGGGSGLDEAMISSNNIKRPQNTCFTSAEKGLVVIGKTSGSPETPDLSGPQCGQNVRRISWRELI